MKNLQAFVDGKVLPFPKAYVGSLFGYWRAPRQRLGIERSIWINASRERVWQAVTDPAQLQLWFSPSTPWYLTKLEVSGKYC